MVEIVHAALAGATGASGPTVVAATARAPASSRRPVSRPIS
ncbi:MAG: hypothetical protein V9E89_16855 [Ilumatobacteraceae bacterium]